MRKIFHIVIHCTATSQLATVESIQNYWKQKKKWKNPGYHKIIKPNGNVVELAKPEQVVNGVKGHNQNSYHICYIGGRYGNDNRTQAQKLSLYNEVKKAKALFPYAQVVGHRDLSPDIDKNGIIEPHEWLKQCPSFDVKSWIKQVIL